MNEVESSSREQETEFHGKSVRLRYESISLLILTICGTLFSIYYSTLIARRFSISDYAIWTMILKYVSYFIFPSAIFTIWTSRSISRGKNTARTSVYAAILFSLLSLPIYLIVVQQISIGLDQPLFTLLLSFGLLFFEYINTSLNSISSGYAPRITGYGGFIMRVSQAISGYVLIGLWAFGLNGAVITGLIGRALMSVVMLKMNWKILKESSFNSALLKSWISTAWLPIISIISGLILTLDVLVVRVFSGSEVPIAYYGVCMSILTVANFSGFVTSALYPKIIYKKNLEDLNEAAWLVLLFSVPIAVLIFIFAEPIIAIFGIKYLQATAALRIFSIATVINGITALLGAAYSGLESADEGALKTQRILHSVLFKGAMVATGINLFYVFSLMLISQMGMASDLMVSMWGAIATLMYLSSAIAFTLFIKADFGQRVSVKYIIKKAVIFSVPGIPAFLVSSMFPVTISEGIYQMVQNVFPSMALAAFSYAVTLFVIEKKFRTLLRDLYKEIPFVR